MRFADVKHSSADRGHQPLVQRSSEVVAVEGLLSEGKLRKGMSSVHDDGNPVPLAKLANIVDRVNLAGHEHDMGDKDDLGSGSDPFLKRVDDLLVGFWGRWHVNLDHPDPLPSNPL